MNLNTLVTTLLSDTRADRVTIRLDVPGMNFPCIAEATAPGISSIEADNSLDQRGAATAQWIIRNRQVLVQPDVRESDTPPPQELIDSYGVLAQMLSPIEVDGDVAGWISVHSTTARPWEPTDVTAARAAALEAAAAIDELHRDPAYVRYLSTSDAAGS